ncbi:FAD-binding protein [Paracoccus endophyticus]|uniref:FAD-binding protein n=1 Tax=Paracoccus endophyticus TaxID=2233774 RepID=UPI000DDC15B5|nr:FAD-binding protein [Paracoccus endophyticus]
MPPDDARAQVPASEKALADIMRGASGPLAVVGGGTRLLPGEGGGTRLSTAGLTGITLYEPAALTIVVRAGTPLAEVEAALAAEQQRLAFEPPAAPGSTIGGVAAANASGPRRVKDGAARDSLIGVTFVDGRGDIVRNGGRVMKNVTGYDLVKLMAGSRGTLGVLTEVAFKTQPVPPACATLSLSDLDPARAVAAMTAALTGPWDVTGAGVLPSGRTVLRVEGLAGSVAIRAETLAQRLAPFGTVEVQAGNADFTALRQMPGGLASLGTGAVWRIVCRPSQAAALVGALPGAVALDWGGALIWAQAPSDWMPPDLPAGAFAVRVHGAPARTVPAPGPAVQRLNDQMRAQFDPRGLFSGRP